MSGLCWPMLSHLGSYVETILRCKFFRPVPPPGAQNHVKNDVFEHRQDKIRGHRRARNTVCFLTPQAKKHRKLQVLQSGGVNRGWVGGRAGSAYNLRLPPKASGKDTGSGPVPGFLFKGLRLTAGGPARQRLLAYGVGRLGRDPPHKPREGYVELRQASCAVLACMEAVWAYVERRLCPCWAIWAHFEPSWAHLGLMLGQVGPMLSHRAHLGPILAQLGPTLGYAGPILGPCWAYVGPMFGYVGPMWPHVEPSWEKKIAPNCNVQASTTLVPASAKPNCSLQASGTLLPFFIRRRILFLAHLALLLRRAPPGSLGVGGYLVFW